MTPKVKECWVCKSLIHVRRNRAFVASHGILVTDGNEVYFFRMILNKAYFIPTLGVRGTSKLRTGVKSKCHHLKDRNHFQIFLRIFNGNFHSRFFFHFPTLRKPTFGQTTMPYRASALPFCLHHCFVQTLKQD